MVPPIPSKKPINADKMAEILEISPRMVRKLATSGKIPVRRIKGVMMFDAAAVIAARADRDPLRGGDRSKEREGDPDNADAEDFDAINLSQRKIAHWRARFSESEAALAEIERQKKSGVLVMAEDERKIGFRIGRAVRDRMMNIADRLASTLAAESDAAQIHIILTREIRDACAELAALDVGEG